jgi:glycosyltransferase involved in cell wall biosynthesis
LRILFVNKYHYVKGGGETAFFSQIELFNRMGHETVSFSMKDEKNYPSKDSKYFVENIDYQNAGLIGKVSNAFKIIYSVEAKRKIGELINYSKPDIAHLHVFQHQLSPSIIWELKKHGIPIVHTIHDLKIICPNYIMLTQGKVCERCINGQFYNCALHKCSKDSLMNSIVLTIEAYLHKFLKTYSYVDAFISPSKFYLTMLEKFNINRSKLFYAPNFLDVNEFKPMYNTDEDYIIYFGRLSEVKGIFTLVDAVSKLPQIKLVIVGTGSMESLLKEKIESLSLAERIKIVGYKSGNELYDLIKRSKFVVLPSEWYENAPYSVLEAMALGKPIIGSRIGGIPEMVNDGINGCLFEPSNAEDMASKIDLLYSNKQLIKKMGQESRRIVEQLYSSGKYYEQVKDIYSNLLNKKRT